MEGKGESAFSMTGHITGVAYSWDGQEGLASYSGHGVYLFDIKGNRDVRQLIPKFSKKSTKDEDDEDDDEDTGGDDENNSNNDTTSSSKDINNNNNNNNNANNNANNNNSSNNGDSSSSDFDENGDDNSFSQCYNGHCNIRTVKEVNFFGPYSEYVVSGSDCGRIFIWDKKTAKLVNMMMGDRDVVNCAAGHPFDPVLATSGIENNVKLWEPSAEKPVDLSQADNVMKQNLSAANDGRPLRNIPASVLHALIRTLARREGDEEDDGGEFVLGGADNDGDEGEGEREEGEGEEVEVEVEEEEEEEGRRINCQYQ